MSFSRTCREFIQRLIYQVKVPERKDLSPRRQLRQKEIAGVACYFNPQKYISRKKNYLSFYQQMRKRWPHLRLLTVELASGGEAYELTDLPDVLRVRSTDVLWQKERLIQIGIDSLAKEGYQKVAWLDGDIELTDPYWPENAAECLESVPLCQLFSESVRQENAQGLTFVRKGVVKGYLDTGRIQLRGRASGYAWAAQMDCLKEVPIFDRGVLGGGDAAIWIGAMCYSTVRNWDRQVSKIRFFQTLGPAMRRHFLDWAHQFGEVIQGRVAYLDQTVVSMYHGQPKNRFYDKRYRWISDFDPNIDLRLNGDRCWEWALGVSSDRAILRDCVARYFALRKEDEGLESPEKCGN